MKALSALVRPLTPVFLLGASVLLDTPEGRTFAIGSFGQSPHFTVTTGSFLFAAAYFVLLFQHFDLEIGCFEVGCFGVFLLCFGLMILAIYRSYTSAHNAGEWKPIRNITALIVVCAIAAERRPKWPFKHGIVRWILDLRPKSLSQRRGLRVLLGMLGIAALLLSIALELGDLFQGAPTRWEGLLSLVLAAYLFRMRSTSPCPRCGYSGELNSDVRLCPNPNWNPKKLAELQARPMAQPGSLVWIAQLDPEDRRQIEAMRQREIREYSQYLEIPMLVCRRCSYRWDQP